jgi:hypothetical protein
MPTTAGNAPYDLRKISGSNIKALKSNNYEVPGQ